VPCRHSGVLPQTICLANLANLAIEAASSFG
jgi:hypothetical protein